MSKKVSQVFSCSHCGAQYSKWTGRCQECGKWSSINKEALDLAPPSSDHAKAVPAAAIQQLSSVERADAKRIPTALSELDRVIGGGFVPGSFILLGGEPGIGKSTLSLQIANLLPHSVYFSGEESVGQITLRADRLTSSSDTLGLSNDVVVEQIVKTIVDQKPPLAIVDSVQTIRSVDVDGPPGSLTQLKACTSKLLQAAKKSGTVIVLIGHVTKEGNVAGPRTLEHLVDTVLYLEGDRYHQLRMLRAVKNRFGSTDELGMFEMTETGLTQVLNPSEALLSERAESASGSVVTCLMEGTRPLLVEIQALVSRTAFGFPVRKASGFDINRLHVLIAVLGRRAGIDLSTYDVHVNVVGGIRASEPAADLAVAFAIASAFKDKSVGDDLAVFGEIGLGGEIRSVRFVEKRIKECAALGMKRVITRAGKTIPKGIAVKDVKHLRELREK
ncbi:MAG: DNA repair protein RadA [Candidatus Magasanikbacteria bacterium]|jgi:DNA repair protein RadA/Sms|nr:DNA repair protein RadA [Candidatus Magasanikbacteria bacterium]